MKEHYKFIFVSYSSFPFMSHTVRYINLPFTSPSLEGLCDVLKSSINMKLAIIQNLEKWSGVIFCMCVTFCKRLTFQRHASKYITFISEICSFALISPWREFNKAYLIINIKFTQPKIF